MKFAIILLACAVAAFANPIQVSHNNIGHIITVNANAVLSNQVDENSINLIAALLNQQVVAASAGNSAALSDPPAADAFVNSPLMKKIIDSIPS